MSKKRITWIPTPSKNDGWEPVRGSGSTNKLPKYSATSANEVLYHSSFKPRKLWWIKTMNIIDFRYWNCACHYMRPFGLATMGDCKKHYKYEKGEKYKMGEIIE